MMPCRNGFSVLELLIAMVLTALVTAALVRLVASSRASFVTEVEVADMQQRLRVAHDTLSKDLIMAGAGPYLGSRLASGALHNYFAPVLPYRVGLVNSDVPGTFKTDTITVIYVPATAAQATLGEPFLPGATTMKLADDCPTKLPVCGFGTGQMIVIFDATGRHAMLQIASVNEAASTVQVERASLLSTTYPAGSTLVEAVHRTYYLKTGPRNGTHQLMSYDGSTNADAPVVDHMVGLRFDYYGDPQPPALVGAAGDSGLRATYGPPPPASDVQSTAYPAGENCTFELEPLSGRLKPRLGVLGEPSMPGTLLKLAASQLVDGPWCPDAASPDRWDADLLRIRRIGVTFRVEASVAALRGPAGVLFTRAGTSVGGGWWAPDRELRFQISPRNLNAWW